MLERLSQRLLSYLERKNWKLATVYWLLLGRWISLVDMSIK